MEKWWKSRWGSQLPHHPRRGGWAVGSCWHFLKNYWSHQSKFCWCRGKLPGGYVSNNHQKTKRFQGRLLKCSTWKWAFFFFLTFSFCIIWSRIFFSCVLQILENTGNGRWAKGEARERNTWKKEYPICFFFEVNEVNLRKNIPCVIQILAFCLLK